MEVGKIVFGPSTQVGGLEPRQRDERPLEEVLKGVTFLPPAPAEDWKSRAEKLEAENAALREYAEATEYWWLDPHDSKERTAFLAKLGLGRLQERGTDALDTPQA